MKGIEYCIGDFLYGIPSSKESEMYNPIDKRAFIYNGCVTSDGYGILVGWHDGEIKKSTGFRNFMWGGEVRKATEQEKHDFMAKLMNQETIKPY